MSYRQPGHEAKERHYEQGRGLWAKHKAREEALRATGMQYADILKDGEHRASWAAARQHDNTCPECSGTKTRMENYDMMWHEADIVCDGCDTYIRMWDAG